jgi:hypothetical protein
MEAEMRHSFILVSKVFLFVCVAISLLILSLVWFHPGKHQPTVWADSSYLFHPGIGEAVIDGVMEADEWLTADAHYRQLVSTSLINLHGTLYVMQSAEDLYLAFAVEDNELTTGEIFDLYGDTLELESDDNNSGSLYQVGENKVTIFAADPWYRDAYYFELGGASEDDTNSGGTTDGEGAVGRSGFIFETNQYELRFPLCSGDDKDFCLEPGDILGLRIRYVDVYPVMEEFAYNSYLYPDDLLTSLVTIEIAEVHRYCYLPLVVK